VTALPGPSGKVLPGAGCRGRSGGRPAGWAVCCCSV